MLSGTGSNRGTKCIPRLARFNPRLALIGFPGIRVCLRRDKVLLLLSARQLLSTGLNLLSRIKLACSN